jgi:hypothetical protein
MGVAVMISTVKISAIAGGAIAGLLYLGCVAWDLLVPAYAMHAAWAPFFPGFTWLTWGGFLIGLVESLAYGALLGWLIAWVPAKVAEAVR